MTHALHRLLRRLLPVDFRTEHGRDMEDVFLEALEHARRRGAGAVLALWLRELIDLAVTGRRLRSQARRFGAEFVARGVGRRWTAMRGGGTMGVVDDLRYAIRSLTRRPSLAVFAVLTIALGVGATTAMFGTVESVVLNPIPYDDGDRMVGLFARLGNADAFVTPRGTDLEVWREQVDVFETIEPWTMRSLTLSGLGEAEEVDAAVIRPAYHDVIGREPLVGRRFDASELTGDGKKVLILSHGFCERLYDTPAAALGGTLNLNGDQWTVIGVMPPGTLLPGWGLHAVDVWIPFAEATAQLANPALGLLREGATVEQANERMKALADAPESRLSRGFATLVVEQVSNGIRGYLGLLMGAVVLLLLIACVNVSNLLLFRANARRQETAVRAALGGGRGRLTRQLLIESLVLALVGGVLGVMASLAGQSAILALRPEQLEVLDFVTINGRVLAFAMLITLGAGLVFGLLPAIQAGRPDALDPLRSGTRTEGDVVGRRLRWMLVSGEVGLSFALLIGSLTVLTTLVERQRVDFGYAVDEVIVLDVTTPMWKYPTQADRDPVFAEIDGALRTLPGVVHVAQASGAPPRAGVLFGTVTVEGQEPFEDTKVMHGPAVSPGYFETMGQKILRGRGFTDDDLVSDADVIVLGESTARAFFPDGEAVGSRLSVGEDSWITVIGVVADVPMTGLSSAREVLQVYHPMGEDWRASAFVVRVGTGVDPAPLLSLMREVTASVDSDLRIDRLMVGRDMQRATLEREQFATTIMAVFATLALLLAAVGLYGVVSQVVGQRTREIGIRMALGAKHASIASMVLKRAGGATAAGIVGGIVLALSGTRLLESQIVAVEGSAWGTFALGALALGLTALLAAYAPARRATRVDPVDAMRTE